MLRCTLLGGLFLSCLVWQGGCGPSRAGFEQVYNGMLQEQVYNLLGAPKTFDPKQWVYEPGVFNPPIVIDFVDGRVTNKRWAEMPTTRPEPTSEPAPRTN